MQICFLAIQSDTKIGDTVPLTYSITLFPLLLMSLFFHSSLCWTCPCLCRPECTLDTIRCQKSIRCRESNDVS